jgi:hypothetical protein
MLLLSFILKKSVVSLKRRSRDYHVGQKLRRESSDVLRVRKFFGQYNMLQKLPKIPLCS